MGKPSCIKVLNIKMPGWILCKQLNEALETRTIMVNGALVTGDKGHAANEKKEGRKELMQTGKGGNAPGALLRAFYFSSASALNLWDQTQPWCKQAKAPDFQDAFAPLAIICLEPCLFALVRAREREISNNAMAERACLKRSRVRLQASPF